MVAPPVKVEEVSRAAEERGRTTVEVGAAEVGASVGAAAGEEVEAAGGAGAVAAVVPSPPPLMFASALAAAMVVDCMLVAFMGELKCAANGLPCCCME